MHICIYVFKRFAHACTYAYIYACMHACMAASALQEAVPLEIREAKRRGQTHPGEVPGPCLRHPTYMRISYICIHK